MNYEISFSVWEEQELFYPLALGSCFICSFWVIFTPRFRHFPYICWSILSWRLEEISLYKALSTLDLCGHSLTPNSTRRDHGTLLELPLPVLWPGNHLHSKLGQLWDSTSLSPFSQGLPFLSCLMFNVCKPLFHIFRLSVFTCFRQEVKSTPCYSTLSRRRNSPLIWFL